jgi:hypothetical protein
MATWPSKDPQSVQDYQYTIALDPGDAVASYTFEKLSGDVVIDSDSRTGDVVTVWLSGGTDGETAVFRIAWATTGGRDDDDIITLYVSSHEYAALSLTGYVKPSPQHLKQRYPAFASVDAGTIEYWLGDGERYVTTSWAESDYAPALMAYAAHNMALGGLGTDASAIAALPAGVTRIKSGSFEAALTDAAANARATGSFGATRYGQEFLAMLRRNRGGPLVMATGAIPADTLLRYPQGQE